MSRDVDDQIFAAVAAERRKIADLIDTLDEDALATPSLCAGWDVKTVAAHLVSVFADSFWKFQWAAAANYDGGCPSDRSRLPRKAPKRGMPIITRIM